MVIPILYAILLGALSVYSYVLQDGNITFFNNSLWTSFRNAAVELGYHQRATSWYIFLGILVLLFAFHWYCIKHAKKMNPVKLALLIGGILMFSYPLLSHDFFNYMFDAKILTFYHQNPYLHKALDYPSDPWIRFMHWVHRPYPYGPVFLAVTVVPAFLGMGKFVIHFFLLKATTAFFYFISVYFLAKIDRKQALFFATQPLVIIEGLVSGHNEIVGLGFAFIGIYYILNKPDWKGRVLMLLSTLVKYMTASYLIILSPKIKWAKWFNIAAFVGTLGLILYPSYTVEIQAWYFLNLLLFVVLYPNFIQRLQIFFAGLLLSYYPYVMLGGWDSDYKIALKHQIILVGLILNAVYLAFIYGKPLLLRSSRGEASSSKGHTSNRK
jgi:hypothetical protein